MNSSLPPDSNLSLRETSDGSSTLYSSLFGETYHSIHGAIAESQHVFIRAGLLFHTKQSQNIFEIGFGTGLNALLTALETAQHQLQVNYTSVEKFPIEDALLQNLHFPELGPSQHETFKNIHAAPWEKSIQITPSMSLHKIKGDITTDAFPTDIDLVYFDAFSPESQPELWTSAIFQRLYDNMNPGGILVTYCAKGIVRRTLRDIGFTMERLAGPPPKREMLRGRK